MIATHNDLEELIEFSTENNAESAIASFPMFSPSRFNGCTPSASHGDSIFLRSGR